MAEACLSTYISYMHTGVMCREREKERIFFFFSRDVRPSCERDIDKHMKAELLSSTELLLSIRVSDRHMCPL